MQDMQDLLQEVQNIKKTCINCESLRLGFKITCAKTGQELQTTLGTCGKFKK